MVMLQSTQPHETFDLVLKIVTALSTLLIGVAAWFLAYKQFTVSKTKLKLDAWNYNYERKLALFNKVKEFCGDVATGKDTDSGMFYHDTVECYLLFDETVAAYIGEVYRRALQVERTRMELGGPNLTEDDRQTLKKRLVSDKTWFYDQAENVIKVFSKELPASVKLMK
jgi:hypothetical protein